MTQEQRPGTRGGLSSVCILELEFGEREASVTRAGKYQKVIGQKQALYKSPRT